MIYTSPACVFIHVYTLVYTNTIRIPVMKSTHQPLTLSVYNWYYYKNNLNLSTATINLLSLGGRVVSSVSLSQVWRCYWRRRGRGRGRGRPERCRWKPIARTGVGEKHTMTTDQTPTSYRLASRICASGGGGMVRPGKLDLLFHISAHFAHFVWELLTQLSLSQWHAHF